MPPSLRLPPLNRFLDLDEIVEKWVPSYVNGNVVDLGCGAVKPSWRIIESRKGKRVIGADWSSPMVELAKGPNTEPEAVIEARKSGDASIRIRSKRELVRSRSLEENESWREEEIELN